MTKKKHDEDERTPHLANGAAGDPKNPAARESPNAPSALVFEPAVPVDLAGADKSDDKKKDDDK